MMKNKDDTTVDEETNVNEGEEVDEDFSDDCCKICDMAFENSLVLLNHNQEIHA